ncbi:MAG: hypothetical protein JWL79_921 [Frankiales bacterium]|nr:hypothetical protein [Frankiales bacterium]
MQIREYSPTTRLIACTSLGDGSRMLFSIAMWHWLGSREVMDKQDVERSYLKRVVDQGEHATSPARAKDLQRGASHIDGLFRSPIWLDCWKAWPDTRGKLAQAKLYLKPLRASQVGLFHNEAGQAITDLVDSVAMGYFPERNSEGYNTSSDFVVSFAMMNRAFFYDEALPVLLEAKKPWTKFALSDPVRRPKSR